MEPHQGLIRVQECSAKVWWQDEARDGEKGLGSINTGMTATSIPKDPSCLNSRSLGYVTLGYMRSRTHLLVNWSP